MEEFFLNYFEFYDYRDLWGDRQWEIGGEPGA